MQCMKSDQMLYMQAAKCIIARNIKKKTKKSNSIKRKANQEARPLTQQSEEIETMHIANSKNSQQIEKEP